MAVDCGINLSNASDIDQDLSLFPTHQIRIFLRKKLTVFSEKLNLLRIVAADDDVPPDRRPQHRHRVAGEVQLRLDDTKDHVGKAVEYAEKDLSLPLEMIIESGLMKESTLLCRAWFRFRSPFVEQIEGDAIFFSRSGPVRTLCRG